MRYVQESRRRRRLRVVITNEIIGRDRAANIAGHGATLGADVDIRMRSAE